MMVVTATFCRDDDVGLVASLEEVCLPLAFPVPMPLFPVLGTKPPSSVFTFFLRTPVALTAGPVVILTLIIELGSLASFLTLAYAAVTFADSLEMLCLKVLSPMVVVVVVAVSLGSMIE